MTLSLKKQETINIPKRLLREFKTIQAMVKIYCRVKHGKFIPKKDALCHECSTILDYAKYRILKCPYKENKPSCKVCPTHCFANQQKEAIKYIMKFSGPRMILRHPLLTIFHFWYEFKSVKKMGQRHDKGL